MKQTYIEKKETHRTTHIKPFYKNLVKFYDEKIVFINGEKVSEQKECRIVEKEKAEKVKGLDCVDTSIYVPHLYRERAKVYMLSKANYEALMRVEKFPYDYEIFEDFKEDTYDEETYLLVLFNSGSHELTDLDGKYIPIPVHVGYMYDDGRMTEGSYDLEDVFKKVKDVALVKDDEELKITNIPWYNATDEESLQLDFYFIPTQEVFEEAQKMKSSFDKVPYMLEKMFGVLQKEDKVL